MNKPNRNSQILKRLTQIFSVIIGLTFIVSGFVKAVDPWGTAIKFNEYFTVYGFEFMLPLTRILAIWLCGAELMMGCMMLFRVRLRLISIFALVSMILFTVITALSISILPVEDCGCFGDALYLTPWQTLAKNLIILPMVFVIWWRYRPDRIFAFNLRELILSIVLFVSTMSFAAYNYFHLPLIDFLPYKVGVDLLAEIESTTSTAQYSLVMVYRNITTGDLHEFSIEDTQWQDATQWEWVETRTDAEEPGFKSRASDFRLSSLSGEDVTVDILSQEGELNIITLTNFEKVSKGCAKRIEEYVANAPVDAHTIIITPQRLTSQYLTISDRQIECYNIDATTLKSMMRASNGVVELQDGVITSKRSCLDI